MLGALERLSLMMKNTGCPHVGLLVCGGSALNILGLLHRSTQDILFQMIRSGLTLDHTVCWILDFRMDLRIV